MGPSPWDDLKQLSLPGWTPPVLAQMGQYARRVGALCVIAFLVNCKPSEPYLTR